MKKVLISLVVSLAIIWLIKSGIAATTQVSSFATPTLVDEINTSLGEIDVKLASNTEVTLISNAVLKVYGSNVVIVSGGNILHNSLTASKPVFSDANKNLVSTGTLGVDQGGSGVATLTDHGILLGSGTSAITPLGEASNGQLPIGSTGADPVLATISGTTDEIDVANGAGTITIGIVNPLLPAKGGTGAATLTDHGVMLGSGTGVVSVTGVGTDGQLLVGQTSADPSYQTMSGGASMAANGVVTILVVDAANLTAGTSASAINGAAITNLNAANLYGTAAAINGAAITALSAANITAGGSITAINGAAITNINSANLYGTCAAIDGSAITALNAANLTAGTTASAINGNAITNLNAANLVGTAAAINGSAITALNAANITAGGSITAINGAAITNLNAANLYGTCAAIDGAAITSLSSANLAGNIAAARLTNALPWDASNDWTGTFDGQEGSWYQNAANLTAGSSISAINGAAITNLNSANLYGTCAAIDGSAITALNAANITAGGTITAINGNAITNLNAANLTGTCAAIDGSAITALNAANITAGTTITAINGAAITNLNAANVGGTFSSVTSSGDVNANGNVVGDGSTVVTNMGSYYIGDVIGYSGVVTNLPGAITNVMYFSGGIITNVASL